jgi:WD40 repeat protein/GTP-binding protein EngB required for normal cell division
MEKPSFLKDGLTAFEILGVKEDCTDEEVNKAKKRLLLKWHPDKNSGNPYAKEASQRILEAFQTIDTSAKRISYSTALMIAKFNYGEGIVSVLVAENAAYGRLFRAVSKMDNTHNLDLPEIVVFGMESQGKSSVLERIAMRELFPRSRSFCTRMVVRLMLRHSQHQNKVMIRTVKSGSNTCMEDKDGNKLQKIIDCSTANQSDERFSKVVSKHIKNFILKVHPEDDGRTVLENEEVQIEIRAPNVPTIDLIDLPGLIQDPSDSEKTYAITRKFLSKKHALVLAVVSARAESLRNNAAFSLLREMKIKKEQCMVILTKIDSPGGDEDLADRVAGKADVPKDIAFSAIIPVVNRDTRKDETITLAASFEHERATLQKICQEKEMNFEQKSFGMAAVLGSLNDMLSSYMANTWIKDVKKDLDAQNLSLTKAITELGIDPQSLTVEMFKEEFKKNVAELMKQKNPFDSWRDKFGCVLDYDVAGKFDLEKVLGMNNVPVRRSVAIKQSAMKQAIEQFLKTFGRPSSSDAEPFFIAAEQLFPGVEIKRDELETLGLLEKVSLVNRAFQAFKDNGGIEFSLKIGFFILHRISKDLLFLNNDKRQGIRLDRFPKLCGAFDEKFSHLYKKEKEKLVQDFRNMLDTFSSIIPGMILTTDNFAASDSKLWVAAIVLSGCSMIPVVASVCESQIHHVIESMEVALESDWENLVTESEENKTSRDRIQKQIDELNFASSAVDELSRAFPVGSDGEEEKVDDKLVVLMGHSGVVNSVAIQDNIVVSSSTDNTVRIWDLEDLKADPVVLEGHSDFVRSVAIQGSTVVSGSDDETVRIWDLEDPKADPVVLEGHSHWVRSVAIQGSTVVSGSRDNTVRIWDLEDPKAESVVLKGHSSNVSSVAIQGSTVVSGSDDETVRIWDLEDPKAEPAVLNGHSERVRSVAIQGKTVVSGSYDKTVRIWDLEDPKAEPLVLTGHSHFVNTVAIQGSTVVSGSSDNTVRIWNLEDPKADPVVLEGHSDYVTSVAIQGSTVVSGSSDNTVRIWDLEE